MLTCLPSYRILIRQFLTFSYKTYLSSTTHFIRAVTTPYSCQILTYQSRHSSTAMTSKSAQKLIPKDPSSVMVIRDVTPQITTFSSPFERNGFISIGSRGTLVKFPTGSLAIFNPVSLTDEVKSQIAAKGKLKYIIAPDIEHHIWVSPWAKEFPEAEVIGPDGLPEKREKDEMTKGVRFHHVFTPGNRKDVKISPEFDSECEIEYVHTYGNKELVLLHKPSKTLIQADLMFNLPATEQYSRSGRSASAGILTRLMTHLFNTQGEMNGQRRLIWYGPGSKDRSAIAESVRRIHGWDFDRIIPCHGDVIETGGKRVFDHMFAWYRDLK